MFFEKLCATPEYHEWLEQDEPLMSLAGEAFDMFAMRRTTPSRRTQIPLIPVVFHVLWNTPDQNVPIEQLYSQLDQLNDCFRALNPDRFNTPSVWTNLIGDPLVQFSFGGVTRTQTDKTSFGYANDAKFTNQGGHDAWDSSKYLNYWVVPSLENDTIGGYAQLPYGPATTDGVVLDNRLTGTTGTAIYPFKLGRTGVHEVGHWFNLFHIWGDVNGCGGTDYVDDTPPQASDNHGRPTFPHVTCNNGPNGDMFMNYMDYTWDEVQVMFTKGQCDRMDLALRGGRPSLMSTLAQGISPRLYDPAPSGDSEIPYIYTNLGRFPRTPSNIGRLPFVPKRFSH